MTIKIEKNRSAIVHKSIVKLTLPSGPDKQREQIKYQMKGNEARAIYDDYIGVVPYVHTHLPLIASGYIARRTTDSTN